MLAWFHARVDRRTLCDPHQEHGQKRACRQILDSGRIIMVCDDDDDHLPNHVHAAKSGKTQYEIPNMIAVVPAMDSQCSVG